MEQSSRRQFLKESGVAAAAVGVGLLGQGTALGGIGPNDTVRAAVIGLKGRGGSHISGFRGLPKVDVVALCDVDANNLAKAGEQFPNAKQHRDFRRLLEQKDIDAVVVATPDHTHALATVAALGRVRPEVPKLLVWDNAPPHRPTRVTTAALLANVELAFLPFRSPELMPLEDLWRGAKAVTAANRCYPAIEEAAPRAVAWRDDQTPEERLRRCGLRSSKFDWLLT